MTEYRFEVDPRPSELGGGWCLRLLEREPSGQEVEVGGGVFPTEGDTSADDAYADAAQTGQDWLDSRK